MGPARAELLGKELGIFNYADLANFFPNRYIDRTQFFTINELQNNNSEVQIIGKILSFKTVQQKRGSRLVATFTDDTGTIELVWFRGAKWIKDTIKLNIPYVIFGRLNLFGGTYSMPHPEMELLSTYKKNLRTVMQPVYPSTEKLGNKGITNRVMQKIMETLFVETKSDFEETLSEEIITSLKLLDKNDAMFNIHFPKSQKLLTQAQQRLKFEEFFFIQLQLILKKLIRKSKIKGFPFEKVGDYFNEFYKNNLPFDLTNAQKEGSQRNKKRFRFQGSNESIITG